MWHDTKNVIYHNISKKITPASDPKKCVGRSAGGHSSHRYRTQEHSPQESMSVFSVHMRSKLLPRNRCLRSSAAFDGKIHVSICPTRSAVRTLAQDPCRDSPCLRIPHKIMCVEPQYLRKSHASGSLQDPWLRARYKIHASGPSARSMSPGPVEDPCLRIHVAVSICANPRQDAYLQTYVSASLSVGPLQGPCLRIHYKIRGSGSSARCMSPDHL